MQFRTEEIDGVLEVVVPDLNLDASNSEEFKRHAARLLEGRKSVAMNLSGIGFMDSAGLGAILAVYKKVRAEGGRFVVFGLSNEVKALFDLVRMQRLFDVCADRESALSASREQ